jgi:hypothetical protein
MGTLTVPTSMPSSHPTGSTGSTGPTGPTGQPTAVPTHYVHHGNNGVQEHVNIPVLIAICILVSAWLAIAAFLFYHRQKTPQGGPASSGGGRHQTLPSLSEASSHSSLNEDMDDESIHSNSNSATADQKMSVSVSNRSNTGRSAISRYLKFLRSPAKPDNAADEVREIVGQDDQVTSPLRSKKPGGEPFKPVVRVFSNGSGEVKVDNSPHEYKSVLKIATSDKHSGGGSMKVATHNANAGGSAGAGGDDVKSGKTVKGVKGDLSAVDDFNDNSQTARSTQSTARSTARTASRMPASNAPSNYLPGCITEDIEAPPEI